MNLQEALDYRNDCLICKKEMILKNVELAAVKTEILPEGIRASSVSSPNTFVLFKFDDTYQRSKKWWAMYVKPLTLVKECPSCVTENKSSIIMKLKPRSVGATTAFQSNVFSAIDNLKTMGCSYAISLYGGEGNKFDARLNNEYIRYYNDESFYHVNSKYSYVTSTIESTLHMGKFKDNLDNVLTLHLPGVNLGSVSTTEELVKKIKLYTIFS
jgi:hypothetical protein